MIKAGQKIICRDAGTNLLITVGEVYTATSDECAGTVRIKNDDNENIVYSTWRFELVPEDVPGNYMVVPAQQAVNMTLDEATTTAKKFAENTPGVTYNVIEVNKVAGYIGKRVSTVEIEEV